MTSTRWFAKDLGPVARSGAAAVPEYCKASRRRHRAQTPARRRGEAMRCALEMSLSSADRGVGLSTLPHLTPAERTTSETRLRTSVLQSAVV